MTIRTYIHSSHKRVESSALLDSGATENFLSMDYAKWLHLPIKRLSAPTSPVQTWMEPRIKRETSFSTLI